MYGILSYYDSATLARQRGMAWKDYFNSIER